MLKLKVIACDVLRREVSWLASKSPCYVEMCFLPQGYHKTPDKLRVTLDEYIKKAHEDFPYAFYGDNAQYDYIVLAYGLCDNGIAGLSSPKIPLVIPRAHDCITLLLGSRERYDQLFHESPGTYWYSRGWTECTLQPGKERYEKKHSEYVEKYGEDNADYLMEMEQGWFKSYDRAFFIDWEELGNSAYYRSFTQRCAQYLNWKYEECQGSKLLLEKILNGIFDEEEVLVVPPGMTVAASFDNKIIKAQKSN